MTDYDSHQDDLRQERISNQYRRDYVPDCLRGCADAQGRYTYPCRVCLTPTPITCEPWEFNPHEHHCDRCRRTFFAQL